MRKWLKELRLHEELTQEETAQLADIGRSYYTHIEKGNKTPSVKVAKRIAETLDFNWVKFYPDKDEETK